MYSELDAWNGLFAGVVDGHELDNWSGQLVSAWFDGRIAEPTATSAWNEDDGACDWWTRAEPSSRTTDRVAGPSQDKRDDFPSAARRPPSHDGSTTTRVPGSVARHRRRPGDGGRGAGVGGRAPVTDSRRQLLVLYR